MTWRRLTSMLRKLDRDARKEAEKKKEKEVKKDETNRAVRN
jgi:hypothetical protein